MYAGDATQVKGASDPLELELEAVVSCPSLCAKN